MSKLKSEKSKALQEALESLRDTQTTLERCQEAQLKLSSAFAKEYSDRTLLVGESQKQMREALREQEEPSEHDLNNEHCRRNWSNVGRRRID